MNDNKMRGDLQALFSKTSGRCVYLIGGGPSLRDVDLSTLDNKLVVCINKAHEIFKNPTALFWCDESWAAENYDNLMKHECKLRFTARHAADGYIKNDTKTAAGATVLRRTGDYGIDSNVDQVRGNNSGSMCLNLLVNMKPRKIILLGFDMTMSNQRTHWHDGYGLPMGRYIYDDIFLPSISSMAEPIKKLGIEVVNCSNNTNLKSFKIDKLENHI